MFPRKCVDYETNSCASSHTKRRVSAHFLTYEIMSMFNFKHMTPCLSHNFPQVQSKQSTTSRLFNLRTILIMQFLTYKTSPCANCHIEGRVCMQLVTISYVLSRLPCFHANVSTTRRVRELVRALKDDCVYFFSLTMTCLCVTFNICQHVCHNRNDVPPLDFNLRTFLCIQLLTHETMSEIIGFTDSKDSVHSKKACLYTTFFDLHGHVRVQILTHEHHVCVHFRK